MKLVNPFDYQKLEQITYEDGKRHYKCPSGNLLDSVTTILSGTGDKSGLEAWAKWVGEKEADKQRREAAGLGTLLHNHLEAYINDEPRPIGTNHVRTMAKNMSDVLIERGLSRVNEIWGIEKQQYYPELYAGTADLIGCFDNVPAIMDYKTSKKMKKEEYIDDYKLQVTAYSLAHNEVYGTDIKTGIIFMVGRDLSFKVFRVEGLEYRRCCDKWYRRLEEWFASIK